MSKRRRYTLGKIIGGGNAYIDLDRLIETRLLVQANSGAGKSWLFRRILEQTHGKVQQIVIDVEDEFHTLRQKYDYVLARPGGDCPAEPKSAALLARRLLELNVSAIISIYELKAYDRVRFVRLFLEALISAPRRLWHPALIGVDECHIFCPQTGSAESAGAVNDMATRGRKRGFSLLAATQRISKLHKDTAAECNNKLIGRSSLDVDMRRSSDELGLATKADRQKLRKLKPGRFYGFGPAISDEVIEIQVGKVETTHPKVGQRSVKAPPPRSKIKKVLSQLSDLPAAAEEEARTVEEFRGQIRTLKRELRAAKKGVPEVDPAAIEKAREAGFLAGQKEVYKQLAPLEKGRDSALRLLRKAVLFLNVKAEPISTDGGPLAFTKKPGVVRPVMSTARKPTSNGTVSAPKQKLLDTLALLEVLGLESVQRVQVALLAGVSPKSSGYSNNLGALKTAGYLSYPVGGYVALTDEGRGIANAPSSPPTNSELHALIKQQLPNSKWRIVSALIDAYPDPMSRPELAEAISQSASSSGYSNNLGSLRTLGLISYPARGFVKALPVLFLGGE